MCFGRQPDFKFLEFLKILLPSQLYETSLFQPKPYICAPIFARILLPIQKFFYQPFAKGTYVLHGVLRVTIGGISGTRNATGKSAAVVVRNSFQPILDVARVQGKTRAPP